MKTNKEVLTSILKTTQMGQIGIRSLLDKRIQPDMKRALESQLREYDSIETEAHAIAGRRGWELSELDPAIRFMTNAMTRFKLSRGDTESTAADMMILGNTRGMIKGLKMIHQFNGRDEPIAALSQKLLDCEIANIRQMQAYL